jgi:hypothetical protein
MTIQSILIAFAIYPALTIGGEQPREMALWPHGVPGFESRKDDPPLAKDY